MFTFPPLFPENGQCYSTFLVSLGIGVWRCVCVCVWGGELGAGAAEAAGGATAAGMQRLGVAAAVAVALWC